MKNNILLLIFCSLLINTDLFSQLKVTTANNIGIGTSSVTNTKTRILNEDQGTSLLLSNNSTLLSTKYGISNTVTQDPAATTGTIGITSRIEPYGTGYAYGLSLGIDGYGTGIKYGILSTVSQNSSSSSRSIGFKTTVLPHGNGEATGIENNVNTYSSAYGDGEKTGIFNYVRQKSTSSQNALGLQSRVNAEGSGTATGAYILMDESGTGERRGLHNEVNSSSQNTAEIRSLYNYSRLRGSGTSYGIYNRTRDYSSATGTIYGIYNNTSNGGSGTRYALYSRALGTGNFAGYFVGDVYINGNLTWTSDERLKTGVKDILSSLDRIMALKPKSYKMKDKPNGVIKDNNRNSYGFIAQEMATVFPDLVVAVPVPGDPIETITTKEREVVDFEEDQDGNLVEKVTIVQEEVAEFSEGPGDTYQSVDYTKIIPFLVRAIQEQQVKIEALEAEMKELKKK